ncbi:MAG: hypothetical protein JST06_01915 [Bacteroidetes bacterium]|nr:hypothetical protein [Bacteroidota bacterium]MBS1630078.1 hypothetical protein [Bacteroidota bacterium]
MKTLLLLTISLILLACNQQAKNTQVLQRRMDSLESRLANTYKPGFGEFMSEIQAHHSKLWFAGQNENWKLADFEVHEIMESFEDIQKFETERKESRMIEMIDPVLDSVYRAIQQKNPALFKRNFYLLTNTCNDCHRATDFEFNVVQVPDKESFSNQDFKAN